MTIDLSGIDTTDTRCGVCIGPPGDDTRRCERPALPLHRLHKVDGISYLINQADEINAALDVAYQIDGYIA